MKLVCSKCKGTKFTEGTALTYTVNPPIHAQQYICSECGNMEEVTQNQVWISNDPKEINIGENERVTSYPDGDLTFDNSSNKFTSVSPLTGTDTLDRIK